MKGPGTERTVHTATTSLIDSFYFPHRHTDNCRTISTLASFPRVSKPLEMAAQQLLAAAVASASAPVEAKMK